MIVSINGKSILDSTEQEIYEIDKHLHNKERWIGSGGIPESLIPYQAVSGNSEFGTAILLLSSSQTPLFSNNKYFDPHRIMVITASKESMYYIRFIWGKTTADEEENNGNYTEIVWIRDANIGIATGGNSEAIVCQRLMCGIDNLWCKIKNITNLATLSFFIGVHEYLR